MPNEKNTQLVEELNTILAENPGMVFIDHTGVPHRDLENLRIDIEKHNSQVRVIKNTLFKIALTNKNLAGEDVASTTDELFAGPTASLFINTKDIVEPIKILTEFLKKYESAKVKGALIDAEFLQADDVKRIASLPNKPELIGSLLRQIQAPIYNLLYALNGNSNKLVYALNAIKESKGGDHNG
jgi:large subunit ribosomal protein L10